MIREKAYMNDFRAGTNAAEAVELKWWILKFVRENEMVTADEIYKISECGDIAMYLALHELVTNNLIEGISPYDDGSLGNHRKMSYRLAKNDSADFFSVVAAQGMAAAWNAEKWSEG